MTFNKRLPLRLNLQHFAEDPDDKKDDVEDVKDDVQDTDPSDKGSDDKPEDKEERRFTQAELDEIIRDRLKREKKKAEDEAEQTRLEEQGEYKELLDKAKQDLAAKEAEIAARDRKDTIYTKLSAKGLSAEDVTRYAKYVEALAKDEDELDSVIEDVYSDYVVAKQADYGDPSGGFGDKKEPKQVGDDDSGRSLYKSLRG